MRFSFDANAFSGDKEYKTVSTVYEDTRIFG